MWTNRSLKMQFPLVVVILLVFLADVVTPHKHKGCLQQDELYFQAKRLLRWAGRHAEHRVTRSVSTTSCSEFSDWIISSDLKNRSLSPWRSRVVTDHELIPSVYEEAECLCSGCIINGIENTDYNSVPVMQSVMFLKKIVCPSDPHKYSLDIVSKDIPVACTCAVPKQ